MNVNEWFSPAYRPFRPSLREFPGAALIRDPARKITKGIPLTLISINQGKVRPSDIARVHKDAKRNKYKALV